MDVIPSRLILMAFALALLMSGPVPAAAQPVDPPPRALVEETTHDFGAVDRRTTVRHTFSLKNDGPGRLLIQQAEMTDPALSARLPKSVLPGAEGRITLELATEQVRGRIVAGAVVHTNDPNLPAISFELRGTVEWPIDILPVPVAFLSTFDGEDKKTVLTLVNNDTAPLDIIGLSSPSIPFRAFFETVRPGREYRLTIEAIPGTPPGRYEGDLEVATNHEELSQLLIPVHLLIKSDLFANPDRLDFGSVSLVGLRQDSTRLQALTQSVFVSAASGDEFEIEAQSEMPFIRVDKTPAGRSATFRLDIVLMPEALAPGPFSGAIRVVSDDARLPEVMIPVQGSVH